MVYVTTAFPCSDPVHAVNAGNITAGIACSFRVTGFGRSIVPRNHTYGVGTESHLKTGISAGIVWVEIETSNFLGKRLGRDCAPRELVG